MNTNKLLFISSIITIGGYSVYSFLGEANKVNYSTEVKPILNKHCIACHGGVKKQGGFSLLFREEALGKTESGKPAIIPGDAKHSEFIIRLTHKDPEERMPLKKEPLKKEEIEILTKWVNQGANWGEHWAFVKPEMPKVPNKGFFAGLLSLFSSKWEKNDIDYFVKNKLDEEGLSPSKQAEKSILLRRVFLDLTGLPPTEKQIQDFLKDDADNAYEKVVDSLLASPQYGERWAGMWLDMARYSDTKGYEKDEGRNIWQYRDYVIKAFNKDLPYNQFIKEQLAGDLLKNPTEEQYIATAFHRNTVNNDEGGTDDEEFRNATMVDRVNTTWEVFQSTTFACVQCHSHPYDPIRHEDYYKSMAFFYNTRDEDIPDDSPYLRQFTKPEDKAKLTDLQHWIKNNFGTAKEQEISQYLTFLEPKIHPHSGDQFINGALADTKYLGIRNGGSVRFKSLPLTGKRQLLVAYGNKTGSPTLMEIHLGSLTGKVLTTIKLDTTQKGGWTNSWDYQLYDLPVMNGRQDWYLTFKNAKVKPDQSTCIIGSFTLLPEFPGKGRADYAEKKKEFLALVSANTENTPVMLDSPKEYARQTHVWERGNWLAKTTFVQPDIPASLGKLPENAPKNRLGLAMWLGSKENPLTARVAVNRFWEQIFGTGLVETLEDFGTQGFTPTNADLLDFLAVKFMDEYQWKPKKLLKEIVMSATYQQDSKANQDLLDKDPMNRLLARGPRVRLSAEQIRDQALLVSGLLSQKMYGKSVMPYQPDGIWNTPYSSMAWKTSENEDQYRRALYTYWRRSTPYPSMITFDGANRDICLARRIRTNTPLQALVTLNDPVYLECAKHLAKKMDKVGGTLDEQISNTYQFTMCKTISEKKLAVLKKLYSTTFQTYQKNRTEAEKLLNICPDDNIKPKNIPDLAAKTLVASTLLNLDEFIMKE
ncbi:DUF1553 domain-containing protein [Arcicella rosea]|uniref:Cytochrome c domain-containing protein n=1 Tax=Arcicella rosea TaxID=502909 RepID=A0A841EQQ4_9BACT|nr:DUF1553 domain-containing protein [Arcicella rosea]MBB6005256.1 hypothetical protein [Arcicella rosea]